MDQMPEDKTLAIGISITQYTITWSYLVK